MQYGEVLSRGKVFFYFGNDYEYNDVGICTFITLDELEPVSTE